VLPRNISSIIGNSAGAIQVALTAACEPGVHRATRYDRSTRMKFTELIVGARLHVQHAVLPALNTAAPEVEPGTTRCPFDAVRRPVRK